MRSVLLITLVAAFAVRGAGGAIAQSEPVTAPPAPPSPSSPDPAGTRVVPVVVIKLTGDLACGRLVARLREELEAAAAAKAELVVLSIEGRRWREDVARGLADVVMASPVPVAALLGPGGAGALGGPVGGGQALVAIAARTCWMAPRATIETFAGDEILIASAAGAAVVPEPSDAVDIVARRNLPTDLAGALLHPATPLHATWEGPERILTLHDTTAPADGAGGAVNLVTVNSTGARGRFIPDVAVRLRMVSGTAADPGQVMRAETVRARNLTQRLVFEDLGRRRTELIGALTTARTLTSQALDRVSASPRGDDPANQAKRRKNGQAALITLQKSADALARAESIAKEFPELLVEPPPGTSVVGVTPESSVRAWVSTFKDAQRDLAKAGERAARAAETER